MANKDDTPKYTRLPDDHPIMIANRLRDLPLNFRYHPGHTEETKAKISNGHYERTPEWRQKISEANKGKVNPLYSIEQQKETLKQYYIDNPEMKEHLSDISKSLWENEDYRSRSAESHRKYFQSLSAEQRKEIGQKTRNTKLSKPKGHYDTVYKTIAEKNSKVVLDKAEKRLKNKEVTRWMVKKAAVSINGDNHYFQTKREVMNKYIDTFKTLRPGINDTSMGKIYKDGKFLLGRPIKGARGKKEFYDALPGWIFFDYYEWEGHYAVNGKLQTNITPTIQKLIDQDRIKIVGETKAKI